MIHPGYVFLLYNTHWSVVRAPKIAMGPIWKKRIGPKIDYIFLTVKDKNLIISVH